MINSHAVLDILSELCDSFSIRGTEIKVIFRKRVSVNVYMIDSTFVS